MSHGRQPQGVASLHLAQGVSFLNEADAVVEAMLDGWRMQQLGGRHLRDNSVQRAINTVKRFLGYTNKPPWEWSAADFDEWMMLLVSEKRLAPATIRVYQGAVRQFCDYLCSSHYGWVEQCLERFGTHPVQVCHEWNTLPHLQDHEARPQRRPLSRIELQLLFDHADAEVTRLLDSHKKGALPAFRDATLLKVLYAWGLRANEAVHLDITDFHRNARAPQFGELGILQVRFGKASRGSPPKRRPVASLYEWAVEAVRDYIDQVRPLMVKEPTSALWLSERGTRLRTREISDRFAAYRAAIGLDPALTPHALRHSYVTHLVEDGADPTFVQRQVGHAYQSTTAIYTAVSSDYMNTMMAQAITRSKQHFTGREDAQ